MPCLHRARLANAACDMTGATGAAVWCPTYRTDMGSSRWW